MTYPGQGWPGQPQPDDQGQPPAGWPAPNSGGWPPPDQGQQPPGAGWPQQQYPYGQEQFPQQPYQGGLMNPAQQQQYPGQQPYPTMQYPINQPPYGQVPPGPTQPGKRRSGLIIGAVVAVVVLVGGGLGTWFAFNHAARTGSASPQAASAKLVADLTHDDLLGLINDLPPAEASLLRDINQGGTQQLKRLNVIKGDVATVGAHVRTQGLRFDDSATQMVNDHLAITKLVAGTITIHQQVSANDFTESFLHSAFPDGVPNGSSYTLDITRAVQNMGHPVRIATVKVDGEWYPSLFYSIADAGLQAAHQSWPSRSVPAVGASSADDAVRSFVQAFMNEDARTIIERTAPDEMGALHDAGQVLIDAAGPGEPTGLKIESMNFTDRDVAGGVDTVLRDMTVSDGDERITISLNGTCYTVRGNQPGQNTRFCASDVTRQLRGAAGLLPPEVLNVVQDMANGLVRNGVGIVATEVDGQWYVSPGRTVGQLVLDLYGSISQQDLAALLQLGDQLGNPH